MSNPSNKQPEVNVDTKGLRAAFRERVKRLADDANLDSAGLTSAVQAEAQAVFGQLGVPPSAIKVVATRGPNKHVSIKLDVDPEWTKSKAVQQVMFALHGDDARQNGMLSVGNAMLVLGAGKAVIGVTSALSDIQQQYGAMFTPSQNTAVEEAVGSLSATVQRLLIHFQLATPGEPPHPNLDKIRANMDRSQLIGQYLNWMRQQGKAVPATENDITKLVADFLDINLAAAEEEKKAIAEYLTAGAPGQSKQPAATAATTEVTNRVDDSKTANSDAPRSGVQAQPNAGNG